MTKFHTLWGVYHADGGLVGELSYVLGKLRGTAHCALCDITHGAIAKKPAFRALEQDLQLPLRLVHLNEQPEALSAVTNGRTPCVVGEGPAGFEMLLDPDQLAACDSSVERFGQRLVEFVEGRP